MLYPDLPTGKAPITKQSFKLTVCPHLDDIECVFCRCRFKMAENIDSELKRMGQDLKEIIDQMNSANSHQEEDSTVSY